jgi:hypothetical protein
MKLHKIGRFAGILTLIIFSINISVDLVAQPVALPDSFHTYTIGQQNNPDPGHIFTVIRPQTPKYPGYLLIMDNFGTPLYYKYVPYQSGNFAVQPSGLLSFLRNEDNDGRFYMMDSSYQVVDSVRMENYLLDSHDFIAMENGHFLIFGLELRTMDLSTLVDTGNVAATVKGCVIQELDAEKNVVFEWNSFDHYEITDTYNDLSASSVDYVHPNALEIDHDGNILLLARAMNEITKIDRNTGDIIWRLGGKNNEFDFADTSHLFSLPHDIQLLGNGNYTVFDNGNERNPNYSRAAEYEMDEEARTIELVWEYDANKEVFGRTGGSTRRLPSGTTLLGYGGRISDPAAREVHPDGSIALELSFDNNMRAGRVLKFPWHTTLFEPVVDSVNFGEWDGYTEKVYLLQVKNNGQHDLSITSTALHGNEFRVDETLPFALPAGETSLIKVVMYPEGSPEGSVYHDILTLNADRDSTERIAIQVHLMGHYPDITSPVVSMSPDTDTIQTNAVIQILFNESVRISDGSELTDENVGSVVVFREENENGPDVPVTLKVSEDKTSIEMTPLSELDAFQYYFLKIRAELEDYSSNLFAGKEKTYMTTPSLGFEALEGKSRFEAYPNPVSEILNIHNSMESGSYDLSIYSVSGQLIHSRKGISDPIYSLNLSSQAPGFYLLKIEAKAHAETLYLKITKD